MSSALAHYPAPPFTEPSKADLPSFRDGRCQHTEQNKSWQSLIKEGIFGSSLATGLPTPPETRAMTGISLNQHTSNDVASQNYYPSKFSYPSHCSASGTDTRHYSHNVDTYNHNHTSSLDQPQFWPANGKQNTTQPPKEDSTSDSTIATYLQIPSSINDSKGSLAEFAAEITCLFWFESAATLKRAEESPYLDGSVVKPLAPDAFPTMGFLKWVTTILSTTQVTQNVILLALLFIHRLKKFNPGVSGKKGSEYRLLTIALMLGNKFLDDNTYTNKTWAEVSGISVSEIHIMEVEFLSNMRYNLYVSEEEWKRWHVKLSRFSTYFNKASKTPLIGVSKPVPPVTPINPVFPYKLPSPPSPARYAAPTPIHQSCLPNPMNIARYSSQSPSRHYFEQDHNLGSRKRSLDYSADLPAAKRVMPTNSPAGPSPATLAAYAPGSNVSSNNFPDIPLNVSPIPKLPMPTVSSKPAPMPRQQPHLAPLSVPPARAMSIVYPNSQNNWSQPVTPVGTMPPSNMNLYANAIPTLGELTRSQYASANASPNAGGYGTLTPTRQLSPSYFLTHRNSPYRPVRSVNTLLIPPPSASLQHANRSIGHDQMRYQPLGKAPTEARAGVVPYIHHDAWPQPWNSTSAIPHINFHPPSRSLS